MGSMIGFGTRVGGGGGGGLKVLPINGLMGWHFHDWIDWNGVEFPTEFPTENGSG